LEGISRTECEWHVQTDRKVKAERNIEHELRGMWRLREAYKPKGSCQMSGTCIFSALYLVLTVQVKMELISILTCIPDGH